MMNNEILVPMVGRVEASRRPASNQAPGLVLLLGVILSACTTPPVDEFRAYRDAYNQAQDAARIVIADFASTKTAFEKFKTSIKSRKPAPIFDQKFDPSSVKAKGGKDIIAVRLLAFDTIASYNEAMLALVGGKRAEEASKAIGDLGTNVQALATGLGSAIPGLGALLPIGQSLIALAQKEADRQAFVDALRAGRPIIDKITNFLVDDTKTYFTVKSNLLEVERNKYRDEASTTTTLMIRLAADHKAPTTNVGKLASDRDRSAKQMREILLGLRVKLTVLRQNNAGVANSKLPFGTAATLPAYNNLAQSQMAQFVETLKSIDKKRTALAAKLTKYHVLLTDYVLLLREVQSTLLAASAAPERRQSFQAAIGQLMPVALQIKDAISQVK